MAYMRLGDLLIAAGAITQEQLEEALTIQKQTKERLGDVLIENNIITEQSPDLAVTEAAVGPG